MNNIEKLAIEHASHTGFHEGNLEQVTFTINQLEAFAKALQSSEPVAEVRCRNGEVFGYIPSRLLRDMLPLGTKLFTHPPASVPLEKYNKLLDALRFYADKNHVNFGDNLNKNFPNVFAMKYVPISGGEYPACIENGEVARQAIAEAEGEEG